MSSPSSPLGTKTRCQCKKINKSVIPKIPRPKNAFILYRQSQNDKFPNITKTSDKSRAIASKWRKLTPSEKQYWQQLAEEERKAHKEKYPDYQYFSKPNEEGDKKICDICMTKMKKDPTSWAQNKFNSKTYKVLDVFDINVGQGEAQAALEDGTTRPRKRAKKFASDASAAEPLAAEKSIHHSNPHPSYFPLKAESPGFAETQAAHILLAQPVPQRVSSQQSQRIVSQLSPVHQIGQASQPVHQMSPMVHAQPAFNMKTHSPSLMRAPTPSGSGVPTQVMQGASSSSMQRALTPSMQRAPSPLVHPVPHRVSPVTLPLLHRISPGPQPPAAFLPVATATSAPLPGQYDYNNQQFSGSRAALYDLPKLGQTDLLSARSNEPVMHRPYAQSSQLTHFGSLNNRLPQPDQQRMHQLPQPHGMGPLPQPMVNNSPSLSPLQQAVASHPGTRSITPLHMPQPHIPAHHSVASYPHMSHVAHYTSQYPTHGVPTSTQQPVYAQPQYYIYDPRPNVNDKY